MLGACPQCQSDNLRLLEDLPDKTKHLKCDDCQHDWIRGEPRPIYRDPNSLIAVQERFVAAAKVKPAAMERAEALKAQYLARVPEPDPAVAQLWATFREAFDPANIDETPAETFKGFANSSLGANPGTMTIFNNVWADMGDEEGARRLRLAIKFLLVGPEDSFLGDRLTILIDTKQKIGINGFREALLTKVLCVMYPDDYIPILKYTGMAGKKEVARLVYDVELPKPETSNQTVGRSIVWGNEVLRDLVGDGFVNGQHKATFLTWAKTQPA